MTVPLPLGDVRNKAFDFSGFVTQERGIPLVIEQPWRLLKKKKNFKIRFT